jgi:S-adenosylmethionine-dependent methyltransferase
MEDISDIAAYYDREKEREQTRLDRHQLEHDLTWRYLDQYLPKSGPILEIGAATGRYTLELARRGYQVTALDLSQQQLDLCRERLEQEGLADRVELVVADVRDLSQLTGHDYSAVLLMGPLYHLVAENERKIAVREVYSRLKEDGLIFSAFISRFGIMGDLLANVPDWVENQSEVQSILARGRSPEDFPKGGFRGYFSLVDEIAPLHEEIGFETLVLAGVEPAISADDDSYNRLEGERRRQWLDLLFKLSTEKSTIGASRHFLYIGRKK